MHTCSSRKILTGREYSSGRLLITMLTFVYPVFYLWWWKLGECIQCWTVFYPSHFLTFWLNYIGCVYLSTVCKDLLFETYYGGTPSNYQKKFRYWNDHWQKRFEIQADAVQKQLPVVYNSCRIHLLIVIIRFFVCVWFLPGCSQWSALGPDGWVQRLILMSTGEWYSHSNLC